MPKIKQTSFLLRVTPEEKKIIIEKADKENLSMNEFIKRKVLSDDINENIDDIKNDIKNDIIDILREQLKTKDMQISNLQQIIYNRDTKLIETSKKWWKFWK
jgi:bifunctional DNA-binding transcriptional regulator/antitoxin component of YhaV-PrlF toxin-antitoxin module